MAIIMSLICPCKVLPTGLKPEVYLVIKAYYYGRSLKRE